MMALCKELTLEEVTDLSKDRLQKELIPCMFKLTNWMKCEENQVGREEAGPVVSVHETLNHQKHHTA